MCGIVGISLKNETVNPELLGKATALLHHRGPDSSNTYISQNKKTGFGHTRLSFIDLSPSGSQPMTSADSQITVVLNGEIYNYIELREELMKIGCVFQTQTDTEVLIHAYRKWENGFLNKLHGMFALAIYDQQAGQILIARDRFGIKPLYFYHSDTSFCFASEIKSILQLAPESKKIRHQSISEFLANRYVPTPYTIWNEVYKLIPGTSLTVDLNSFEVEEKIYMSDPDPKLEQFGFTEESFGITYTKRLIDAVSKHLRSDVPIGAFLSGGMDSSTLVCMMQKELNYPTKAFSIGFENWDQSEDQFAKMVADSTGAELFTSKPKELNLDSVEKLMWHFDDPIADISIIPTFEVSKLAGQHVKAVVSGEGADETLGGYWWHKPENFKHRSLLSKLIYKFNSVSNNYIKSTYNFNSIKSHYIEAMSMGLFDFAELKKALVGEYAQNIPLDPFSHLDPFRDDYVSVLKQLQIFDFNTFMRDLVLPKIDRASMAHSLEVRVPFLHLPLVETAIRFPEAAYFKNGVQKLVLKKYLSGKVPDAVFNRPKQGFVGPDKYYMNMDVYKAALVHGRLVQDKVVNPSYIDQKLKEKDHWRLWKLFVLENWWKNWM